MPKVQLRPVAYATGLTVSTDGTLRILPLVSGFDAEIMIQERPGVNVTRWSIDASRAAGCCFNRDREWEYETLPSNRDDDFYRRCRFASLEEAVAFLEEVANA